MTFYERRHVAIDVIKQSAAKLWEIPKPWISYINEEMYTPQLISVFMGGWHDRNNIVSLSALKNPDNIKALLTKFVTLASHGCSIFFCDCEKYRRDIEYNDIPAQATQGAGADVDKFGFKIRTVDLLMLVNISQYDIKEQFSIRLNSILAHRLSRADTGSVFLHESIKSFPSWQLYDGLFAVEK